MYYAVIEKATNKVVNRLVAVGHEPIAPDGTFIEEMPLEMCAAELEPTEQFAWNPVTRMFSRETVK